jgi:hypothetical protein
VSELEIGIDPPAPAWERREGQCLECNFDWSESSYDLLVGRCVQEVALFGAVLARTDPADPVAPGLWSASRYVWHTVDVLRFGTERLWTLGSDPSFGVPVWDENVMAGVRSYDNLSPIVGLIALIDIANTWKDAALDAPRDVTTPHPEAGTISAFDIVQRNAHEVRHHLWDIQRT